MKKCASCTKDLPDAALHCVFCGAKQPPAPATAGSVAKTVMGHASPEMIEQLKAQAAAAARPAPSNIPAAAPYSAPQPAAPQPARPNPITGSPVPPVGSNAPTMFAAPAPTIAPSPAPLGGPPPGMGTGPGMGPGPMGPGPMGPGPMGPGPMGPGPMGPGPMGPSPAPLGQGPVGPAPTPMPINQGLMPSPNIGNVSARPGRPIEPWRSTLRLMMFVWGAALLVAFFVPVATEPDMAFMFNLLIDGEGLQKLEPILMIVIGLGAVMLAAIPTPPSARGLIAGLLGLLGVFVPMVIALTKGDIGLQSILVLVGFLGLLTLVPGLLLRSEYRDALLPRLLVTIGALCVLLPDLIPQNGDMPLIAHFTRILDAEGTGKVTAIINLLPTLFALLSLLCWLPAPSSGLGLILAWCFIAFWGIEHFTDLILAGNIGDVVKASPNHALVSWIPITSYIALTGFGFATVFGKQLE